MNATLHEVQSTVAEEMRMSFPHLDEEQIQHMVMFGLAEEAGEVVGLMKRRIRGYKKDRKKSTFLDFAEELGDVLWYLAACCQVENITLNDIWKMNREKLEARYGKPLLNDVDELKKGCIPDNALGGMGGVVTPSDNALGGKGGIVQPSNNPLGGRGNGSAVV